MAQPHQQPGPNQQPGANQTNPNVGSGNLPVQEQIQQRADAILNNYVTQGLNPQEMLQRETWMDDPRDPANNPQIPQTDYLRAKYAHAYTRRSDSVIGRGTKANLERATVDYHVHQTVLGALAAQEIMNNTPGNEAQKHEAVRKVSLLQFATAGDVSDGHGGTVTLVAGESVKLAETIEQARIRRAGSKLTKSNSTMFGRQFNKLADWYGKRGRLAKVGIAVGVGVVSSAVAAAAAPVIAPAAAGALVAGVAAGRTSIFANLHRHGNVKNMERLAHTQSQRMVSKMREAHDENRTVLTRELVEGVNKTANRRIYKNRFQTFGMPLLAAAGVHFGSEGIADGARHLGNALFGHGAEHGSAAGHPEPSPSPDHSVRPSPHPSIRSVRPTPRPSSSSPSSPNTSPSASPSPTGTPHPTTSSSPTGTPHPTSSPSPEVSPSPSHTHVPTHHQPHKTPEGTPPPETAPTTLEHLNAHQTGELVRTWATGTNANEMTHFVNTPGGIKVVLENVQHNETLINGHDINSLKSMTNLKVAITEQTPEGPKIIFVSMHNGVADIKGPLAEYLKNGHFKDAEIMSLDPTDPTKVDVYSTVVGANPSEISNHTFAQLLHAPHANVEPSAATPPAPATTPVKVPPTSAPAPTPTPTPTEHLIPQSAEVTKYEQQLYDAYAKANGGATGASLETFREGLRDAFSHGQLELISNGHGGVEAIMPDPKALDGIWQPANAHQIFSTINSDVNHNTFTGAYVPPSAEVTRYADMLYQQYGQAVSRATFNKALQAVTSTLNERQAEILQVAGAHGHEQYEAITPNANGVWSVAPPREIVERLLAEVMKESVPAGTSTS